MISMCACGGVNCPHCNPNLWTNAGLTPPVNTHGENPLQARIAELEVGIQFALDNCHEDNYLMVLHWDAHDALAALLPQEVQDE